MIIRRRKKEAFQNSAEAVRSRVPIQSYLVRQVVKKTSRKLGLKPSFVRESGKSYTYSCVTCNLKFLCLSFPTEKWDKSDTCLIRF